MVWRRGLLGLAYRRASAASAGLRESRERLQDSSFRSVRIFGHDGVLAGNQWETGKTRQFGVILGLILSSVVFLDRTRLRTGLSRIS